MKGKERPTIRRAKEGSARAYADDVAGRTERSDKDVGPVPQPLANKIRDGLTPYLDGMLKTIGQAGAGKQKRGQGDLRAALGGLRLLMDSYQQGGGETDIMELISAMRDNAVKEVEAEEMYWDDPDEEDTDLEALNEEIDSIVS